MDTKKNHFTKKDKFRPSTSSSSRSVTSLRSLSSRQRQKLPEQQADDNNNNNDDDDTGKEPSVAEQKRVRNRPDRKFRKNKNHPGNNKEEEEDEETNESSPAGVESTAERTNDVIPSPTPVGAMHVDGPRMGYSNRDRYDDDTEADESQPLENMESPRNLAEDEESSMFMVTAQLVDEEAQYQRSARDEEEMKRLREIVDGAVAAEAVTVEGDTGYDDGAEKKKQVQMMLLATAFIVVIGVVVLSVVLTQRDSATASFLIPEPSQVPSMAPIIPTLEPTHQPTPSPSNTPSRQASATPSVHPSMAPSEFYFLNQASRSCIEPSEGATCQDLGTVPRDIRYCVNTLVQLQAKIVPGFDCNSSSTLQDSFVECQEFVPDSAEWGETVHVVVTDDQERVTYFQDTVAMDETFLWNDRDRGFGGVQKLSIYSDATQTVPLQVVRYRTWECDTDRVVSVFDTYGNVQITSRQTRLDQVIGLDEFPKIQHSLSLVITNTHPQGNVTLQFLNSFLELPDGTIELTPTMTEEELPVLGPGESLTTIISNHRSTFIHDIESKRPVVYNLLTQLIFAIPAETDQVCGEVYTNKFTMFDPLSANLESWFTDSDPATVSPTTSPTMGPTSESYRAQSEACRFVEVQMECTALELCGSWEFV